jgi:hypothetical protein
MRFHFLIFMVLVVAGCKASPPEPEKMIESAIAAHAGKENLAKVTMARVEGTSTGEGVDLTWDETIHFPGTHKENYERHICRAKKRQSIRSKW